MFDTFLQERKSYLSDSHDRAWGKTTIVNTIAFDYEALGYDVGLITQYPKSNIHFATFIIDKNLDDYCGKSFVDKNKIIVIVDEIDCIDKKWNIVLQYLRDRNIPYVGFAKLY